VLIAVVVLIAIGTGVAVVARSTNEDADVQVVDTSGHALPHAVVVAANHVLAMAESHDLKGLDAADSQGVSNNPAVIEQTDLLSTPGGFDSLVDLLRNTRATAEPGSLMVEWTGGEYSETSYAPGSHPPGARDQGLQANFFQNRGHWVLSGVSIAFAGSFVPFGPYGPFLGGWGAHDTALYINPDGSFAYTTRGFACPSSDSRCQDRFVGDFIIDGLNATGRILSVRSDRLTARVTTSTLTKEVPLGPTTFTFHPTTDTVSTPWGTLCGLRSPVSFCGA
jgi:hypothetical protein